MEPGNTVGLRRARLRFPRVEAEVVVIAAGGHEQDVAGRPPPGDVPGLEDDIEAEDVDVERTHPVDVRRAQVHVPDANLRVGRSLGRNHRFK
jgi:hypothetical protein